jgi:hypothetical protein
MQTDTSIAVWLPREATMSQPVGPAVHVLLFECSNCGRPLAVAVTSAHRNLEDVDGDSYKSECDCGWSGTLMGTQAKRHWVDGWRTQD